jgi:hypothetical protein
MRGSSREFRAKKIGHGFLGCRQVNRKAKRGGVKTDRLAFSIGCLDAERSKAVPATLAIKSFK